MTTTTTIARTIRLAIGTAAVLALMSQAAQARPIIAPHNGVPVHESSSTLVRKGTYMPVSPANNVALVRVGNPRAASQFPFHQLQQATPPTAGTTGASAGGFDWAAASIGAGLLVALVFIGAAALTGGRRHVPRSA
jgi:hypothetical protein